MPDIILYPMVLENYLHCGIYLFAELDEFYNHSLINCTCNIGTFKRKLQNTPVAPSSAVNLRDG